MEKLLCVAHAGLCSFSSLPRVSALKRLTLGCYVWPFQGHGALFQSPFQGPWGGSADCPFRALDRAVSQAFRARLSATLSGYPVISVMEALQGLNPPA
jgi:hypothetical protein